MIETPENPTFGKPLPLQLRPFRPQCLLSIGKELSLESAESFPAQRPLPDRCESALLSAYQSKYSERVDRQGQGCIQLPKQRGNIKIKRSFLCTLALMHLSTTVSNNLNDSHHQISTQLIYSLLPQQ